MQMTRTNLRLGAASLLALWCTINQFRVGHSNSSADSCFEETILCFDEDDCNSCLVALQATTDTINPEFEDCSVLFASVCTFAVDNGCTVTNPLLEDYAACFADEEFGCPGFVSCADADAAGTAPPTPAVVTAAPTTAPSAPPSTEDVSVTPSPSDSDAAADAEAGAASSGVAHTVAKSMKPTLALVFGLAILLSA
ncbi:unnamed protein product [Ectocarpus fasciculatus]